MLLFRFLPLLVLSGLAQPLPARLLISEVQIDNQSTLEDEDGDFSDWIEITNAGDAVVDLSGYELTNGASLTWAFPAGNLAAKQRLVVFASGKDRKTTRPWHASFALKAGEPLTLLGPDGEVVSTVAEVPEMPPDATFGVSDAAAEVSLVAEDAAYLSAGESKSSTVESPRWAARKYATTGWEKGRGGLLWQRRASGFWLECFRPRQLPATGLELSRLLTKYPEPSILGAWAVPSLNFADAEAGALSFAGGVALPKPAGITQGTPLIYKASGMVKLATGGTWTLGVEGFIADNTTGASTVFRVDFAGQSLTSDGGGGGIIIDFPPPRPIEIAAGEDVIIRPLPRPDPGSGNVSLRTVTVPRAGEYPVTVWWLGQPTGGVNGFEVTAAPGEQAEFSTKKFRVLGTSRREAGYTATMPATAPIGKRLTKPGASVITRTPFTVPANAGPELQLKVQYADGFRAWIDGQLVAERNAPIGDAFASRARTAKERAEVERVDLVLKTAQLPAGTQPHMLVVQALQAAGQSSLNYVHSTLVARAPQAAAEPEYAFFEQPTPHRSNAEPMGPPAAEPQVSVARGVYGTSQVVTLTSGEPTAQFFYTLDGSLPVQGRGTLYRGPIAIDKTAVLQAYAVVPGKLRSHAILHTYLITANQGEQTGEGFPAKWLQQDAAYTFDAASVAQLGPALAESLRAIPSVSVVLPVEEMFGSSGMYPNSSIKGKISASDASAEWLFPQAGAGWREKATIRIKGEASRSEGFLKHGFRLDFGSGKGDLRRPVLGETDRERYNTLMLHGSFVDNIFTLGKQAQYVRDLWVRDTLRRMGQPAAHGDFLHLYINGLYWGLYHAGERSDAHWCAHYLGGTKDDWDVIDSDGLIDGTNEGWAEILEAARSEQVTAENYAKIADHFDLVALCDYMLANIYAANTDWPGHNWYAIRDKRTNVWRFITWDAEYSFDRPNHNMLVDAEFGLGGDPGDIFRYLSKFPVFNQILADRLRLHTSVGGALSPEVAEATWMNRANVVESAVSAEYARWGGLAGGGGGIGPLKEAAEALTALTITDWRAELERIRTTWFPGRAKLLIRQFKAVGLFPDVYAPVITPGGGFGEQDVEVTIANTASNAVIYYTTDGSDPRGPETQPSATATRYTGAFTVTRPTLVKACGYYDGEASPVVIAHFQRGQNFEALAFSEVSYAPPVASEEFVEVTNNSSFPVELTDVVLRGAVRFSFASGTVLQPGQLAVVVRSAAAFTAKYPEIPVAGVFTGALSDDGETLELWHPTAGVIDRLSYRPHEPWPLGAGAGLTLYRVDYTQRTANAWGMNSPTPGQTQPTRRPVELAVQPPAQPFAITLGAVDTVNREFRFTFPTEPGYRYQIQSSTDLQGPWQLVRDFPEPAERDTVEEVLPMAQEKGFFRVKRLAEN